jgi:hypothetical protein
MVYELLSAMDGTKLGKFSVLILLRGFINTIIFLEPPIINRFFLARNIGKCNTTFENIGCKYRISYA